MSQSARMVLVDDHTLVRAGLRALLEDMGHVVVAEGSDGLQAQRLVCEQQPDVLLMDIDMPQCSGLEALAAIRQAHPQLPVVLLSMHDTRDFVVKAMHSGAAAYLLKDAAQLELQLALQAVLGGQRYLSPRLSAPLLESPPRTVAQAEALTERQREVLYWLARGRSNKEIAFELGLSVKTVDNHRAQLMDRLAIRDLAGLVVYAVRQGILRLDE